MGRRWDRSDRDQRLRKGVQLSPPPVGAGSICRLTAEFCSWELSSPFYLLLTLISGHFSEQGGSYTVSPYTHPMHHEICLALEL